MSSSIAHNLEQIQNSLGTTAKLIAVTKTKPIEALQEAYAAGQRHFAENKVQEIVDKQPQFPADVQWHIIGHLQTNKVKYIASFIHLIHAVDSLKLLEEINKQALKHHRVINCLLQVYIATEETKFGLSEQEIDEIFASETFKNLQNIKVIGLMGMASNTDDAAQVNTEFSNIHALLKQYKASVQLPNVSMEELSTGMSGDYSLAVKNGSTMVRIGSAIFGPRL
jgi:PLP dependent protein